MAAAAPLRSDSVEDAQRLIIATKEGGSSALRRGCPLFDFVQLPIFPTTTLRQLKNADLMVFQLMGEKRTSISY